MVEIIYTFCKKNKKKKKIQKNSWMDEMLVRKNACPSLAPPPLTHSQFASDASDYHLDSSVWKRPLLSVRLIRIVHLKLSIVDQLNNRKRNLLFTQVNEYICQLLYIMRYRYTVSTYRVYRCYLQVISAIMTWVTTVWLEWENARLV